MKAPRGRPPRLAHLVAGTDRQLKRRALQQPQRAAPPAAHPDILCLPSPEWLPHLLSVDGPPAALAAFAHAAAGPGIIPWAIDYDRLQEDWAHAMLAPPPAERGICVDGARILAADLRAQVERQARDAEAAPSRHACPLDLHALLPVPPPILRLGPDDPVALAWLWQNWTTTWPLRGVAEVPAGTAARRCYRFWSADWTPWQALAAIRVRWPGVCLQVQVRGVAE